MKPSLIDLEKPIKVFQVFRSINQYTKDEKSFAQRKEKIQWRPIESTSGFVKAQIAYLPTSIVDLPALKNCDLLFILDDNLPLPANILLTKEHLHYLKFNKRNKLDIFEILVTKDQIDLHFKYGYFEVGTPERSDMKLCELREEKAVEVKINGKNDFSLTGRRARTFQEQAYIFSSLGEISSVALVSDNASQTIKPIPENRKLIDLNKPLW